MLFRSPNPTFIIEEGGEEGETGRSVVSLSLLQSTIEGNLAVIRGMVGEGCTSLDGECYSVLEGRASPPLPASLPDLEDLRCGGCRRPRPPQRWIEGRLKDGFGGEVGEVGHVECPA